MYLPGNKLEPVFIPMRYYFFLLALLPLAGHTQSMTADSLIAKVESVYANAETYSDDGVVETQFFSRNGRESRKSVKEFSTLFVRNRIFRFSYISTDIMFSYYGFQWDSTNQVVSRTFGKTNTYQEDSPNLLIAGATGVSSGSSHTVSKLLLPETVGGRKLFVNPESYVLAGIDEIEGIPCYRLELPGEKSFRKAVWIETESLLIRQIQSSNNRRSKSITTTTYQSAINFEANSTDLVYNPKKESRIALFNNLPRLIWEAWDIILIILFLAFTLFHRRRHKKLLLESEEKARRSMLLRRWANIIVLTLFILLMAVEHLAVPVNLIWITLLVIMLGSLFMGSQYITISDRLFKQRFNLTALFFAVIMLVIFLVIMLSYSKDHQGFFWEWYPIISAFIIVYAIIMTKASQRHHKRLINRTPFDHSETDDFSQKASFFQNDNFLSDGRLLLLSDRLILIYETGKTREISRSSILSIEIKNFFQIWPHKLVLVTNGSDNFEIRIAMPYYWRKKILEN